MTRDQRRAVRISLTGVGLFVMMWAFGYFGGRRILPPNAVELFVAVFVCSALFGWGLIVYGLALWGRAFKNLNPRGEGDEGDGAGSRCPQPPAAIQHESEQLE